MRKFLLTCLFVLGLGFALFNFKGLANQGEFQSIVLDFREDVPAAEIAEEVRRSHNNTTSILDSIANFQKLTISISWRATSDY
jgi:hypothetical protein